MQCKVPLWPARLGRTLRLSALRLSWARGRRPSKWPPLRLRQNGNLLKVRIHRSEELAHLEGHTVDVRVMSRTLGEPTYVRVSRLALPPVLPRTPPGIVTPLRGKARKKKLGREAAQRKAR